MSSNPIAACFDPAVFLSDDILLLLGTDGIIEAANDRAEEAYGQSAEELRGRHRSMLKPKGLDDDAEWETAAKRGRHRFESVHRTSYGTLFPVEIAVRAGEVDGAQKMFCSVRDISRRVAAEIDPNRLVDMYETLLRASRLIPRVGDRRQLFRTVCDFAAETGRFRLAWIGCREDVSGEFRVSAHQGPAGAFLEEAAAVRGAAFIEGLSEARIIDDFDADPSVSDLRACARRAGIRAAASFPIFVAGKAAGSLNLYSDEPRFFRNQIALLLMDLAQELTRALDRIEREYDSRRMQEEIAVVYQIMRNAVMGAAHPIAAWNAEGRYVMFNASYSRLLESLFGLPPLLGGPVDSGPGASPGPQKFARTLLAGHGRNAFRCSDFGNAAPHLRILATQVEDEGGASIGGFLVGERDPGEFFELMPELVQRNRSEEAAEPGANQQRPH